MSMCGTVTYGPNTSACLNNYTSIPEAKTWSSLEHIVELYVIGILCVIGLIGNILSMVVLRCDRERREALLLLQSLAVADSLYLLTAILKYPVHYLVRDPDVALQVELTAVPLLKSAQTICIWTMVLVTVDRYVYVCIPLRARNFFNPKTRRIFSVVIFIAGLLYNAPRFFDSCIMTIYYPCTGLRKSIRVYTPFFNRSKLYFDLYMSFMYLILLYIGPLTVLIVLNVKLIYAIIRSRRRHRQLAVPMVRHGGHPNSEANATFVLVIIIMVFLLCETPELMVRTVTLIDRYTSDAKFGMTLGQSGTFYRICNTVSKVFMVLNSTVNFFIYVAFGKRFRHYLKEALQRPTTTMITHESVPLQHQLNQGWPGMRSTPRPPGLMVYTGRPGRSPHLKHFQARSVPR